MSHGVPRSSEGNRLKRWWTQLTGFLTAEEVPRWFGLSLVLIYLVGLATVTNVGIRQARRETSAHFRGSALYATEMLVDRLASLPDPSLPGGQNSPYERAMGEFAAHVPVRSVRLLNGERVLASIDPSDFDGVPASTRSLAIPSEMEVTPLRRSDGGAPDLFLRAAVHSSTISDPLLLEVVLIGEPPASISFASHAGAFSVLLVVLGAFFVVYRCLREQLRGVARIADRLYAHRDRIRDELTSLRIADSNGLDGVTTAWNELVNLTQHLLETVQRTEANQELSRVLQNSGGGALAEALHAVPDGIIHIRDESRVDYANATACRLLGWNTHGSSDRTLDGADGSNASQQILSLIRGSLGPDGKYEPCTEVVETEEEKGEPANSYRVWVVPLTRGHHSGECVILIRDVSQQMRAERAREEFVTQVTHELRTPLTNIRAYAETLSSGMFEDPKVITECYNVITKETRRLSRLIEDILSVSQLEVGSIHLAVDNVDLRALLTDGVRDVRGVAEEKSIDLQLVLPAKLETIRGDRDKLAVVINNLLGNAIKYTPRDGTVIVGCQMSGQEAMITVKDNGIGIEGQYLQKVFGLFEKLNPISEGTGIGLALINRIIEVHGGRIWVESEGLGKGSTFCFTILGEGKSTQVDR